MDKGTGVSLVMVNSLKGERFFDLAKPRVDLAQVPLEEDTVGKPEFRSPLLPQKVGRKVFFDDLGRVHFPDLAQKYAPLRVKGIQPLA